MACKNNRVNEQDSSGFPLKNKNHFMNRKLRTSVIRPSKNTHVRPKGSFTPYVFFLQIVGAFFITENMRVIGVFTPYIFACDCDVADEWVAYPFCAIAIGNMTLRH